ncbi:MAG: chromosome segregation protein SMC [Methylophilaceae bacterium]|nr:MAG: chromosome segregation protein SMC [Methylophilaceae bacterium]
MRLTHLKLAGFKSFVDPTTVHLHGQRVGVVGPNGCGKSNVMESVRWVLGESSAKEMRADAMDAVIFNGSSNRKPISRASVELIFDNSLGGASGEWSQYAEISVKRVIERQKGSSYYINNTAVRRRDVADLFLGTGLGGRAYAIIGQNTISRIVEAKPEELRIFLEEAAGISKYKDRRRETELRLRDTRENLTRVEDICRELQKQISRLQSQAVVTQKYHAMQASLTLAEGQYWLLKRRDASNEWEKAKANVEKLVIQLEAQTAELRKSETGLENSRQAFYQAGEAINKAQAAYYEANAEVANLENQVKQHAEARDRMTLQLQQLDESIARHAKAKLESNAQLMQFKAGLASANDSEQAALAVLEGLRLQLPQVEADYRAAVDKMQASTQALLTAQQRIQIDGNNIEHLNQTIADIKAQIERFEMALQQLEMPDAQAIETARQTLAEAQEMITNIEHHIQQLRSNESATQVNIAQLREQQQQAQRVFGQAEAELHSLEKIQQSLNAETGLASWLSSQGLQNNARLWEKVSIDDSWTLALEAVLGERLNALLTQAPVNHKTSSRPPSALVVGFSGRLSQSVKSNTSYTPLISMVKDCSPEFQTLINDWLANIYLLPDDVDGVESSAMLAPGEKLVNKQGDVFSLGGVVYHGKNNHLHGVIARQQRLADLRTSLPNMQSAVTQIIAQLTEAEADLAANRQLQQQEGSQLKLAMQTLHQHQLVISKLEQLRESTIAREKSLKADIETAQIRHEQQLNNVQLKQVALAEMKTAVQQLEAIKVADENSRQQAEQAFNALRDATAEAEKKHQQLSFDSKIINNNINDLNNKINVINEEEKAFALRKAEVEQTLNLTPMETLKANLTQAITVKQRQELALSEARNHLEAQEADLKERERVRMQHEQQLNPMRDTLEQGRLREQEARLYFEQCQAGLQENGMDEKILLQGLDAQAKASDFAEKTSQLQRDIERLGPVNLAAIQELDSESERKAYLDSQMQDLIEASETLEAAINKIDKETRDKLLTTFNEANQHFGELFSTLFGGGQAKLELLGEEILDTGLQVFAQPPGKKNTTIQLLSGGEKALTALALVFALFRLNPAPFCLMDEVDAPLDDSNTERFCAMVKKMSERTQFLFVSHNKITMEIAQQLIGVTMQESGVSRIVDVDIDAALQMQLV